MHSLQDQLCGGPQLDPGNLSDNHVQGDNHADHQQGHPVGVHGGGTQRNDTNEDRRHIERHGGLALGHATAHQPVMDMVEIGSEDLCYQSILAQP